MIIATKSFWTIEEVATYLNESKYTIYSWVAIGKIPVYRRGRNLRFNIQEILAWDESNHKLARCGQV